MPSSLQTQRKQIRSAQCKLEVARQLVREAADIRFDHTLAQQCQEDRSKHCSHVQQVGDMYTSLLGYGLLPCMLPSCTARHMLAKQVGG